MDSLFEDNNPVTQKAFQACYIAINGIAPTIDERNTARLGLTTLYSALLNTRRAQDELLEKLANTENEINKLLGNPFTK